MYTSYDFTESGGGEHLLLFAKPESRFQKDAPFWASVSLVLAVHRIRHSYNWLFSLWYIWDDFIVLKLYTLFNI